MIDLDSTVLLLLGVLTITLLFKTKQNHSSTKMIMVT